MTADRFVQTARTGPPLVAAVVVASVVPLLFLGVAGVSIAAALIAGVLVALLVWTFSRLEVEVDDEQVRLVFGVGFPRRSVPLGRVREVQQVRNSPWYGWGIRWIRGGTLWNVWGLDAVELTLDDGRLLRIGTDRPAELAAAIDRRR